MQKQKTAFEADFAKNIIVLALGYSPRTGLGPSTIAANRLNCCVREGNRCTPVAASTKTITSFVCEWKIFKRDESRRAGLKHFTRRTQRTMSKMLREAQASRSFKDFQYAICTEHPYRCSTRKHFNTLSPSLSCKTLSRHTIDPDGRGIRLLVLLG